MSHWLTFEGGIEARRGRLHAIGSARTETTRAKRIAAAVAEHGLGA